MSKRIYRYIVTDGINPNDEVSDYRLLSANVVSRIAPGYSLLWSDAVRVDVTNIKLEKYSCDSYSTACGHSKIKDLNPKICIRKNFKWTQDKELTEKWLNGEIKGSLRKEYLEKVRNYKWTYRGFFTPEGYSEYKKYEADMADDCKAFATDWAKSHYSEKDFEIFKKWLVSLDVSTEMYLFRKDDWKWLIKDTLERKMEHYRITDEIYNTTKSKKVKDSLIQHELIFKQEMEKQWRNEK